MFCDQCGAKVGDNSVFCTECGSKIAVVAAPETAEPVEEATSQDARDLTGALPEAEETTAEGVEPVPKGSDESVCPADGIRTDTASAPVYVQPLQPAGKSQNKKKKLIIILIISLVSLSLLISLVIIAIVANRVAGRGSYSANNGYIDSIDGIDYPDYPRASGTCPKCGGTGSFTCSSCHGSGSITSYKSAPNYGYGSGGSYSIDHNCPACGGTGSVTCYACGGDGYLD